MPEAVACGREIMALLLRSETGVECRCSFSRNVWVERLGCRESCNRFDGDGGYGNFKKEGGFRFVLELETNAIRRFGLVSIVY